MQRNKNENYNCTLENEIKDLKKQYSYYYLFNITKNLTDLLSKIISEKEGKEYLCRSAEYKCLKHSRYEYIEPYMDYELKKFNGELVRMPSYHSEEEKKIIVPEKKYVYLIIYEKKNEKVLNQFEFKNKADMNKLINKYTVFNVECTNFIMSSSFSTGNKVYIADINAIEKSFPYLKYLLFQINQWRKDNMRMIPDETIINDSVSKVYKKNL